MIRVALEEEYGYRLWIWEYPGTEAELLADWKARKAPLNFFDPSKGKYAGKMIEVTDVEGPLYDEYRAKFPSGSYYGHVHMHDDTYLVVAGQKYIPDGYEDYVSEESKVKT